MEGSIRAYLKELTLHWNLLGGPNETYETFQRGVLATQR